MANTPIQGGLVANPQTAPAPQGKVAPALTRPTVQETILAWAATLTPAAAPKPADKGHLAWVRETKVPELLAELNRKDAWKLVK